MARRTSSCSKIHSAPSSAISPLSSLTECTRPPTRSRASTTMTLAPASWSSRAAARPAKPAPTTTTSTSATANPVLASDGYLVLLRATRLSRGRIDPGWEQDDTSKGRLRARPTESQGVPARLGPRRRGTALPRRDPGRLRQARDRGALAARPGHPGEPREAGQPAAAAPVSGPDPHRHAHRAERDPARVQLGPVPVAQAVPRVRGPVQQVRRDGRADDLQRHLRRDREDDLGPGRGGRLLPGSLVDLPAGDRRAASATSTTISCRT